MADDDALSPQSGPRVPAGQLPIDPYAQLFARMTPNQIEAYLLTDPLFYGNPAEDPLTPGGAVMADPLASDTLLSPRQLDQYGDELERLVPGPPQRPSRASVIKAEAQRAGDALREYFMPAQSMRHADTPELRAVTRRCVRHTLRAAANCRQCQARQRSRRRKAQCSI
jgi:hypothetical protein